MFGDFLKSLSILKKFLFINLVIFLVIGSLTLPIYKRVKQPITKKIIRLINKNFFKIDKLLRKSSNIN